VRANSDYCKNPSGTRIEFSWNRERGKTGKTRITSDKPPALIADHSTKLT
jgi:hypothetical protein